MIKKKYKVTGMHCSSCALNIEWNLEDLGVKAKCQYASSELEVEFDETKVGEPHIKKAVEEAGYTLLT